MPLNAVLTVGWKDDSEHQFSARKLHDNAKGGQDYESTLLQHLQNASTPITIYSTEQLFRRHVGGYHDIKNFVASLMSIVTREKDIGDIYCLVDVFSYAFLKGAKNFDFQLPERKVNFPKEVVGLDLFRKRKEKWEKEILPALEDFERIGKPLPKGFIITKELYLDLRGILSRGSARDEQRALATLLVSGPSTMKEISDDLGLNYTLGNRILGIFADIGVVVIQDNDKYVISLEKLPVVVFFLREIMGLDFLSSL
jgi:hypothetical protein